MDNGKQVIEQGLGLAPPRCVSADNAGGADSFAAGGTAIQSRSV